MTYHDLFPALSGDTVNKYNPTGLTTSVQLPDGRTYELRYNPWGELARVELPTGGAIEYDYDNFPGTGLTQAIHRRVTARRVYVDKNNSSNAYESISTLTEIS
jgi:YD repeat-containing protein